MFQCVLCSDLGLSTTSSDVTEMANFSQTLFKTVSQLVKLLLICILSLTLLCFSGSFFSFFRLLVRMNQS